MWSAQMGYHAPKRRVEIHVDVRPQRDLVMWSKISQWSQALGGLARTGLAYGSNPYDVERYEEVLRVAAEMASSINEQAQPDPELRDEIAKLWREEVRSGSLGYATPKVTVGAIVFDSKDRLLLVKTSTDGWTFPVGYADIGYAPSEVVQKEVREESGLEVTPLDLIGVVDSFRQRFNLVVHIYCLLFYCRLDGGSLAPQTVEVTAADFFEKQQLPTPLVVAGDWWVEHAFAWHTGHRRRPHFE